MTMKNDEVQLGKNGMNVFSSAKHRQAQVTTSMSRSELEGWEMEWMYKVLSRTGSCVHDSPRGCDESRTGNVIRSRKTHFKQTIATSAVWRIFCLSVLAKHWGRSKLEVIVFKPQRCAKDNDQLNTGIWKSSEQTPTAARRKLWTSDPRISRRSNGERSRWNAL